jgi:hypothetical protein
MSDSLHIRHISERFSHHLQHLKPPQKTVEKMVCEVVSEVCHISLESHQVRYTVYSRTVSIQAPSIIKTEIQSAQNVLLDRLKQRLGAASAPTTLL